MRIVKVKPQVVPLVSGEVIVNDTDKTAAELVASTFTDIVFQEDFTDRLMVAAAGNLALQKRVASLVDYEVDVLIDELRQEGKRVTIRYTAFPGRRLQR